MPVDDIAVQHDDLGVARGVGQVTEPARMVPAADRPTEVHAREEEPGANAARR
jgi:hypothetical protein